VYLPGTLSQAILKLNATAMSSQLVSTGNSESTLKLLAPTSAAIGIALWTILFLGITVWSFRKQDLSD
jgi:ABC-type transport system involved in multi-copper enzyme maturation permease subunit